MRSCLWALTWIVLSILAGPASAQSSASKVVTAFSLLVGVPEAETTEVAGDVVVSGMVIPMDTEDKRPASELKPRVPADLIGKLRNTLRLEHVKIRYSMLRPLTVGERSELRGPADGSTFRIFATLLGFNGDIATYRIEILDGEEELSNTPVSVQMGKRVVVGALDGEAAPYLFLVTGPEMEGDLPPPPEQGRPRIIEKVIAVYPQEAKDAGIQGVVILKGTVQIDGRVTHVEVTRSDSPLLDRAAVDAMAACRFQPARDEHGNPVPVTYTMTTRFVLR
jgi:TonB family protein